MCQSPPLKPISATTLFIKHYKSTSSINSHGKPPQPATRPENEGSIRITSLDLVIRPGNEGSFRITNSNLAIRPGNMGDIRTGIGFH